MSFKSKLIIGVILLVTFVTSGMMLVSQQFIIKTEKHELIKHANVQTTLLANHFKNAIISSDLATLHAQAADTIGSSDIRFLRIKDDQNRILVQVGSSEFLNNEFVAHTTQDISEDLPTFNIQIQIQEAGYNIGQMELGYSLDHIRTELKDMNKHISLLLLLGLLIATLLSFALSRYLTSRITQLEHAANSVANGDLDFELNIKGNDEISNTGKTFNSMVRNLKLLRQKEKENFKLIATVQDSQDIYIQNRKKDDVFNLLLKNILYAVECEYGFIGLIEEKANGTLCLNIKAVNEKANSSEMNPYFKHLKQGGLMLDNLDTLFGEVIRHKKVIISNDLQHDMRSGNMPSGHPDLYNMLCIPLVSHEELIAVIGVANRAQNFTHEFADNLKILWQSTAHIIQAYLDDNQKRYYSETLTEREEYLSTLFDNVLDSIITTDKDGIIIDCNPATENISGYSKEELIGENICKIMPKNYQKIHPSYLKGFVENPTPHSTVLLHNREVSLQKKDGSIIPIEIGLSELHGVRSPAHFIGVIRDISEQKDYISALESASQKALDATRAKSDFLAVMSHEIRTPMHGILGMLQLVDMGHLDKNEKDKISSAYFSAKNLLHLLDNILDFSKVESGKLELDSSEFNLCDLVDDTLELFTQKIIDRNNKLDCTIAHDMPEWFIGDPTRLRQILVNLIGNAVKFTQEGIIRLSIDILEKNENTYRLGFKVTDTGIGIAPEVLEKIFDPFSQADSSTTRNYGGTGLGLAITSNMVKLMGGHLEAKSDQGKGSCFCFEITMAIAQRDTSSIKDAHTDKYIYIIDRANHLNLLHRYFDFLGASFTTFTNSDTNSIAQITRTLSTEKRKPQFVFMPENLGRNNILKINRKLNRLKQPIRSVIIRESYHDSEWLDEITNKDVIYPPITYSVINKILESGHNLLEPHILHDCAKCIQGNILLVEDNEVNQLVAIGILEKFGCTVEVADNGKTGFDKFIQGKYDLVLMDYQMPVMDGLEATQLIRQYENTHNRKPVPIIALTANAVVSDLERYIQKGMNDYLTKPFTLNQMYKKLQQWIDTCSDKDEQRPEENRTAVVTEFKKEVIVPMEHVNIEKLNELESMLGDGYNHLLQTFISNAEKTINALNELCESRNEQVEEIGRLAHSLKGTTGNVGASSMHTYAVQLDKLAKEKDLSVMPELMSELELAFEAFRTATEKKKAS